jgi:hypothetical protein
MYWILKELLENLVFQEIKPSHVLLKPSIDFIYPNNKLSS